MKPLIAERPARALRPIRWWTTSPGATWNEARPTVVARWAPVADLDALTAVDAMAFGHAARAAWPETVGWPAEIESVLRAEWSDLGHAQEWRLVRGAVRHGWDSAGSRVHRRIAPLPG